MSPEQVFDLLRVIASGDRRTVGEPDVAFWHATVGDLDFDDAREAVIAHFRESTAWLQPAHVRDRVHAARRARLAAVPDLVPGMVEAGFDPDDPNRWFPELQRRRAAAMERHPAGGQRQLEGGHRG